MQVCRRLVSSDVVVELSFDGIVVSFYQLDGDVVDWSYILSSHITYAYDVLLRIFGLNGGLVAG